MNHIISGLCRLCGDSVTVYDIVPEKRWTMDRLDPEYMGKYIFEELDEGAENNPGYFMNHHWKILVAGKNFGCGSKSVEHPVAALQGAGVELILAESFSRYSFRNALNLGLPAIICPGITEHVHTDDLISVNLKEGILINITANTQISIPKLSEFARKLIESGGNQR